MANRCLPTQNRGFCITPEGKGAAEKCFWMDDKNFSAAFGLFTQKRFDETLAMATRHGCPVEPKVIHDILATKPAPGQHWEKTCFKLPKTVPVK